MTPSRVQCQLANTLSLDRYLSCVLSCLSNINEFNILYTQSTKGIILKGLRQPSSPLRLTSNGGRRTSSTGRTTLSLSEVDVGALSLLILGLNLMDLYLLLLPLLSNKKLNSSLKIATSLFLETNLTLFGSICFA